MFWRLSLFYLVPGTRFCLGSCWTRVIMRYKHPCRVRPGFTFPGSPQPLSVPSVYWVSVKVKVARSCPTLCHPMHCTVHGILQARILELGSLSLLQWIFPTQGLNLGPLHYRQILYHWDTSEALKSVLIRQCCSRNYNSLYCLLLCRVLIHPQPHLDPI